MSDFWSFYVNKIITIKGNPISQTVKIPLIYVFSANLATHKHSYVQNNKPVQIALFVKYIKFKKLFKLNFIYSKILNMEN